MRLRFARCPALLLTAMAGCAAAQNHRTDWFQQAGWGVFTRYLADTVAEGEKARWAAFSFGG
jgi:hypothetical protein